jgi:RimJ/RimL family protein N-acetyltransferase
MYMTAAPCSLTCAAPDRPETRGPAYQDHDRVLVKNGGAAVHAAREADELALLSRMGLTVRSVRATDKSALSDLFNRLSSRSRHYRFLGLKKRLSPRELENLTDIDHVEREALALVGPDGRFIAVARYGPVSDDPNAAEVALTVADEWQGHGIGSALASLLIAQARRNRIVRLQAMTLAENYPSRKLLRRLGFTVSRVDGDVMSLEMQLVVLPTDGRRHTDLPRTHNQPHRFGAHEMSVSEQRRREVLVRSPDVPVIRPVLGARASYVLMAAVIGLALFASGTPTPLYATYAVIWSLAPVVPTLVYATYAFGVLTMLLLAGPVSDYAGRRPVLLVALGSLMAASVAFALANSVAWLFVARGVQGLATGLALSTASAALLDLHPSRDASAVGLHNGIASMGGLGLGVLVSALMVQLLPSPRVLPYIADLLLFAVAFVGTLAMVEPVSEPVGLRLRPQRPAVPPAVRPAFLLAALGVLSSWSIGGLSLALGPELLESLFHTTNYIVGGLSVFVLGATAAASQVIFRRSAPWAGAAAGSVGLAAGLLGIVLAAASKSGVIYLGAIVVVGAGFGAAFLGALRALSSAIPSDQRSSIMSAFYLVAYASLSLPAIAAGILTTMIGLRASFEILSSVIAAIAILVAALAWHTRHGALETGTAARSAHVSRSRSTT